MRLLKLLKQWRKILKINNMKIRLAEKGKPQGKSVKDGGPFTKVNPKKLPQDKDGKLKKIK